MLLLILVFAFIFATPSHAGNDIVINCTRTECQNITNLPLFYEPKLIPGFPVSQQVQVQNNQSDSCNFSLSSQDKSVLDDINSSINLKITTQNKLYFDGSLDQLHTQKDLSLGNIDKDQIVNYLWTLTLDPQSDDQIQGSQSIFDFNFSYNCNHTDPSPTSTPTSTPDPQHNITLNEIHPRSINSGEWIEIQNQNNQDFTLDGWKITDAANHTVVIPKTTLVSGAYLVVTINNNILNDGGDTVTLSNPSNIIISSVTYPASPTQDSSYSRQSNGWCFTSTVTQNSSNAADCLNQIAAFTPTPIINLVQVAGVTDTQTISNQKNPADNPTGQVLGTNIDCRFVWFPYLFLFSLIVNIIIQTGFRPFPIPAAIAATITIFILDTYYKSNTCLSQNTFVSNYYWFGHLIACFLPILAKIWYGKHDSSKLQK